MIIVSAMGKKKERVPYVQKMTVGDAIAKADIKPGQDSTITLNGDIVSLGAIIEKDGSKVVVTPKVANG